MPALTAVGRLGRRGVRRRRALGIGWNVITVSLRQRIVPDHLLGRVNAGYRLLAWGTMPLGAALGGLVGDRWGLTAVFWTSAVLSALCLPIDLHHRHRQGAGGRRSTPVARSPGLTSVSRAGSHRRSGVLMSNFDLTGRHAVVTGGARGIGAGIAEALATAGAAVMIGDILDDLGRKPPIAL